MIPALLTALGIYLLIGFLIALPFAFLGAKKIDPAAVEGSWGFKILIIPGAAIFWPVLLKRWIKKDALPVESSQHRN